MIYYVPSPPGVPAQVVTVGKSDTLFTSVKDALDSIGDASVTKPYQVTVASGVYTEEPFTIPSYVTLSGAGPYATVLKTSDNFAHFITGSPNSELNGVSVEGPSNIGFACIDSQGVGDDAFRVFNVEIHSGYYGIWHHPVASGLMLCDEVFNYSRGLLHTFMYCSGFGILRGVICAYRDDDAKGNTYGFRCEGANAQMYLDSCIYKDTNGVNGLYGNGGAVVRVSNMNFAAAITAVNVGPDTGPGGEISKVDVISSVIRPVVTNHINIQSPVAECQFSGSASNSKITSAPGATFLAQFSDTAGGTKEGNIVIGEQYIGDTVGNTVPVKSYLQNIASSGVISGGEVTRNIAGGLDLDIAAGEGFVSLSESTGIIEVSWNAFYPTVSDDSHSWIVVDSTGSVGEVFSAPDNRTTIVLAEVVTRPGNVVFLGSGLGVRLYQSIENTHTYRYESNGPRCISGVATTANVAPLKLNVDGGSFYIGTNKRSVHTGTAITFTAWYRDPVAQWVAVPGQTVVDDEQYNQPAGNLGNIPGGESTGHVLYVASTDAGEEYHLVYGQDTDLVPGNLTLPVPPDWLSYTSCRSGQIIVLKSAGVIASINDVRPFSGSSAVIGAPVTDHALLAGLGIGDDHPQYQLRTEKGGVSGYCPLTVGQVVPAANVPFTAVPASAVTDGAPSAGAGTEVARQNHVHFHGNLAAVDGAVNPLHSAAVAGVTPGFISAADQTKLDTLPANAPLLAHAHSGAADGVKLVQANTHESPDTDSATTSLHHTIGTSATQVAAGNHTHVWGLNYQSVVSLARSTYSIDTTFQTKSTLTTGALTGTFRVGWDATIDGSITNREVEARLWDATAVAIIGVVKSFRPGDAAERASVSGIADIVLAGVSKTIEVQYRTTNILTTVGISDARIEFWRVA